MRSIKTFAVAAFLAISVTAAASGQSRRPFRDSWFWGVRSGVLTYSGSNTFDPTQPGVSSLAPLVGADWMITRTHGGLYVSFAQAFFSTTGAVLNGPTSADSGYRSVQVDGLRRIDIVAMTFPGDFTRLHPYIGFGASFRYLANASALGPFTTTKQIDYATAAINDVKSSLGPAFIAGAQYRIKGISVFGQGAVTVMAKDFLLANGHTGSLSAEFGIRYNMGSSIDH